MPKPPPLSAADAALQKAIPKRTVQAAIARGDLKAIKLGGLTGSYVIEQRDLDRWVAKRNARRAPKASS